MSKLLRFVLAFMIANTISYHAFSQSLGVNATGAAAANSAILDVSSTEKGMLVPRMNKTERNAISFPATGLLVFQNAPDSTGFYYYDGANWLWLATASGSAGWLTTGNAGTTITNNFLGTTDATPLSFRQDNKWLGRWNSITNNYFIGDSSGANISSGNKNVGMGSKALFKNTTAYANVAIGNNALQNNVNSLRNTAIGDSALFTHAYNPGGNYFADNTAIGSKALILNQPTTTNNGIKNTAIGSEAMYLNTTGYENTAIGVSALRENTTGYGNTVVGRSANRASKAGTYNSYLGYEAGYSDSSGTANTAMGAYSGFVNDTARFTVSIGYASNYFNKRDFNTTVGAYAGYSNSRTSNDINQGIENTLVGYAALTGNAFGSQNTAIGFKAMSIFDPGFYSGAPPSRNVAVGDSAMQQNRGNDNVAVGYRSLSKANNTNQNQHVAIGSRALLNTTAAYPNTAVGYSSQDSATTGFANTSLGSYSLTNNKIGYNNTAIGNAAMMEANNAIVNSYPSDNTAVGNDALRFTRYYAQVAVGSGALRNDTSGYYNTAVGYFAMNQNLSGLGNAALGTFAMRNNKLGGFNTAVGYNSLNNHNRLGWNYNTAIGSYAMELDSSGYQNTGVGTSALRYNVTGFLNTAVGINAGYWQKRSYNTFIGSYSGVGERFPSTNYAVDTGRYNTGVGSYALSRIAQGNNNVAVGFSALYNDSSGINNVAVGYGALDNIITGNHNTGIGYNADVSSENLTNASAIGAHAYIAQSNSMVLGGIAGINGATANVNVGIGENTPNARLHIRYNGSSGGSYVANPAVIIEDNGQSFIQLSNPTAMENGILSGNALTPIRSGIVFAADSSMLLRAGGNTTRMAIDNTGFVGVRTTAPSSYLDVVGSTGNAISVSAFNTILDEFDHTHIISNTAGVIGITLPAATTCPRREYVIVNQDNTAKIITSYLDFTGTGITSMPPNTSITVQSNGSNWYRTR